MEKTAQMIQRGRYVLYVLTLMLVAFSVDAAEFRKLDAVKPPPLVLKDINGTPHDLKALKGNVVLVNFWATWCPPCREEMPSMQRLKEKMVGRPFVMLGVDSAEPPEGLDGFLDLVKVDFTVLFDSDGVATKRWKVYGLPTSFLIDKQGNIRYTLTGTKEWDQGEAISLIETMLQ